MKQVTDSGDREDRRRDHRGQSRQGRAGEGEAGHDRLVRRPGDEVIGRQSQPAGGQRAPQGKLGIRTGRAVVRTSVAGVARGAKSRSRTSRHQSKISRQAARGPNHLQAICAIRFKTGAAARCRACFRKIFFTGDFQRFDGRRDRVVSAICASSSIMIVALTANNDHRKTLVELLFPRFANFSRSAVEEFVSTRDKHRVFRFDEHNRWCEGARVHASLSGMSVFFVAL